MSAYFENDQPPPSQFASLVHSMTRLHSLTADSSTEDLGRIFLSAYVSVSHLHTLLHTTGSTLQTAQGPVTP